VEQIQTGLFDYLNRALGTLNFAGSADQTLIGFDSSRLLIVNLINAHRTNILACSAARAFLVVDRNLYHFLSLYRLNFVSRGEPENKSV